MDDATGEALDRIRREIARRGLPPAALPAEAERPGLVPRLQQHRLAEETDPRQVGAGKFPGRSWLSYALVVIGILATVPWLAPLFAAAGWWGLANPIYTLYLFLCHQLPERAATLFGYQVAFCWRNTAIYSGLFGIGVLYALSTRPKSDRQDRSRVRALVLPLRLPASLSKVPPNGAIVSRASAPSPTMVPPIVILPLPGGILPRAISLRVSILTLVPMALDGLSHMLGLRDGLFNNPTFGSLLVGSQFLSLNWWLRISTGLLAAFGTVYFTFPRLDRFMSGARSQTTGGRPAHRLEPGELQPLAPAVPLNLAPTATCVVPDL